MSWLSLIMVCLAALAIFGFVIEEQRKKEIRRKYGNTDVGRAILERRIFQGMSEWQLLEAWGNPDAKERSVLKTKIKETWFYGKARRGFANRVYLENGCVVGWKQRRG